MNNDNALNIFKVDNKSDRETIIIIIQIIVIISHFPITGDFDVVLAFFYLLYDIVLIYVHWSEVFIIIMPKSFWISNLLSNYI